MTEDIVSKLTDTNPAFCCIAASVQGRLCSETVKRRGDKYRHTGSITTGGHNYRAYIHQPKSKHSHEGNRDSMFRQREARGSSDGTGEGKTGEGGADEVKACSVVGIRCLIS